MVKRGWGTLSNDLFIENLRAMSLESILDSESVAADGGHVTLRIKPGVYQKRPDVVLAEMDYKRFLFRSEDYFLGELGS